MALERREKRADDRFLLGSHGVTLRLIGESLNRRMMPDAVS
jgi:hypothetical protein